MATLMTQIGTIVADKLKLLAQRIGDSLDSAKSYTDQKIADLVNSAPETLDTLGEIATALQTHSDALDAITAAVQNHDHSDATTEVHGFMSTTDKAKLDNLGEFNELLIAYNAVLTGTDYEWLKAPDPTAPTVFPEESNGSDYDDDDPFGEGW